MLRVSVDIAGVQVLDRAFNRVHQLISDFRNIWPYVIPEVYGIVVQQFRTQGTHGASGRWAALTPAYAKWKALRYPGQPILQAEGGLFASLTDPDAPDAILRPEKDQLTMGSQHPAAIRHQRGTSRMRPRPIFSFIENDKRRIQKGIQRGLVRFARDIGFVVDEKAA